MSIFCEKYQFSKTKVLSHHFFQICHEKPPVVVQIFSQKTSISVKITPSYGPKISIGWLFFPIFHEKIFSRKKSLLSCPYFLKKGKLSKKTSCSHAHILSKNFHSLKRTVLSSHFFSFFFENPLLSYLLQ